MNLNKIERKFSDLYSQTDISDLIKLLSRVKSKALIIAILYNFNETAYIQDYTDLINMRDSVFGIKNRHKNLKVSGKLSTAISLALASISKTINSYSLPDEFLKWDRVDHAYDEYKDRE